MEHVDHLKHELSVNEMDIQTKESHEMVSHTTGSVENQSMYKILMTTDV